MAETVSSEVEIKEVQEQLVTPWEVEAKDDGKIDYNKLIKDFGCQKVEPEMVARVEKLTGKPAHPFLRRGVFFAHRCGSIITLSITLVLGMTALIVVLSSNCCCRDFSAFS